MNCLKAIQNKVLCVLLRVMAPACLVLYWLPSPVMAETTVQKAMATSQTRPAKSDDELKFWLENMLRYHRFSLKEASEVTGLTEAKVELEAKRLGIDLTPVKADTSRLVLKPYPGGRHPRIGFLDGAVDPQRETKISVFTPWDIESYVVVDVPEAIFSNLGLTYLAHTHIPTIFDKSGQKLEAKEWQRDEDGNLSLTRVLPNGISYTAKAEVAGDEIRMELSLKNGTKEKLSGLKVQQCAMLKGASGFDSQVNDNKIFKSPYAIVRNGAGDRWIVHAWSRPVRVWGNAPCPCLHSDPQFPDLEPGQEAKLVGRLWFYQGREIDKFIESKKASGWDRQP
jgi:hypothetical protein